MKNEIKLYTEAPDMYDQVQNLRPDYVQAIDRTISNATQVLNGKDDSSVVDFCGGTGSMLKKLSELITIKNGILVDINQEFLNIAKKSINKIANFQTICSDIIEVDLKTDFDLVLSVFAYHHVPDSKKKAYLQKAYNCLNKGGTLILTEIYLAKKDLSIKYYDKLYHDIDRDNELLKKFLMETAQSSDYEYKVEKSFADRQITEIGFVKVTEEKIWPLDGSFADDVGTFVQILQK